MSLGNRIFRYIFGAGSIGYEFRWSIPLALAGLAICKILIWTAKKLFRHPDSTLCRVFSRIDKALTAICCIATGLAIMVFGSLAAAYVVFTAPMIPRDLTRDNIVATAPANIKVYKTFEHCSRCNGSNSTPTDCSETTIVTAEPMKFRAKTIQVNGHGIGCYRIQNKLVDGWVRLSDVPIRLSEIKKHHILL